MSLNELFHDTILLTHPHYLHEGPDEGSNVVVWFSHAEHGVARARVPVCVVKVVEQQFVLSPQPHGRLTAVTGPCRMVGKTLFIFASSLAVCKGTGGDEPTPHQPAPFPSDIWPTLVCAGVVSTAELASVQPPLSVVDFALPRRKTVVDVPVAIRCTSAASLGSEAEFVYIVGKLTAQKTAGGGTAVFIDVQDVHVGGRDDQPVLDSVNGAICWSAIRSWCARVLRQWRNIDRADIADTLNAGALVAAHTADVGYPWPVAHNPRISVTLPGSRVGLGLAVATDVRA